MAELSKVWGICHEVMGLDAMIFAFRVLSFEPAFSLSISATYYLM